LRENINRRFDRLLQGFASYQEFFVEFLAAEGVIDKRGADLTRGELWRVVKLVGANPLTREEVERLRTLIEKEELTYDEAVWLRDVARRLILEYGTPETWKLHIYASIWVALARRKEEEERGIGIAVRAWAEIRRRPLAYPFRVVEMGRPLIS
jgi:hypothetical protein